MACPNRNRHRPRTLAFRCTDEVFETIDKRIQVKGDYLREVVLTGEVHISVGKFKSEKLALVLKNLTNELKVAIQQGSESELKDKINESYIIIREVYRLVIIEEKEFAVQECLTNV